MRESASTIGSSGRRRARAALVATILGVVALAGCGDDETAQERYCNAGESLATSLSALTSLDLIAEGTDGLESAVDQVQDDLDDLQDAASDAAADEVDALDQAVDALDSAISDLGGDLTADNASAVGAAIGEVSTAAQAVLGTLSDC